MAVLGAKLFFIIIGFAQQTLLPWIIGRDGYGALSRVLAPTNIVNNVVITSSIQGMSRAVAQTPDERAGETFRRLFKAHVAIAVPVALLFFFFAPVYAIRFQLAPHIVLPLQLMSLVVLAYGIYAPVIGSLNGRRLFTRQAGLDVTYAVLRTAGLVGLGWVFARSGQGQGIIGSCIGFALAALLIVPVSLRIAGLGSRGDAGPTVGQHLLFILPVALGQVAVQLLMQSDITLLGRFASQLTVAQGMTGDAAAKAADEIVAVYRACQLFAFLPYQLLISLTFILFPMLAKAKAEQDREAIASYVRTGMRLSFVFAALMVGTVAGLGPYLLRLVYPVEFSEQGGEALRVLALGQGAFSIFYVETTVLTSLGRERVSAVLTGAAVVLIVSLGWAAGSSATDGIDLLNRMAGATTTALAVAAVAGAVAVRLVAKAYVSPLTFLRAMAAVGAAVLVGTWLPWKGKLLVLPEAGVVALVALLVLVVTAEVGRADLAMVKRVVGRKAG
jgi:stage V sporulation protein B